ncbi:MAG: hypothetical protein ACJ8F1_13585 [Polyangia bacterium]
MTPMRVLLVSGFFESQLVSFREYAYSKELADLGHDVTLMCGDQSYIWSKSRVRLPVTEPGKDDGAFVAATGVRLLRRRVFFRLSDLVLYRPSLAAIRQADVVHVIEFRQGITALVALLARAMGKPVVYDHEQRGDRTARWYSRVDSWVRRLLILAGSFTVDCVRHTVTANRDHFRSCTPRTVEMMWAPLGADPRRFYFDPAERDAVRRELGVAPDERVAIMTGKLHASKHVADVVRACRAAGVRLILVGTVPPDVRAELEGLGLATEILLPQVPAERLRALFNAADVAIFTTFTVSYWEAHATGLRLVLPATEFTRLAFDGDPAVSPFGGADLFSIADEEYRPGVDLAPLIAQALAGAAASVARTSQTTFSSTETGRRLAALYQRIVSRRSGGQPAGGAVEAPACP